MNKSTYEELEKRFQSYCRHDGGRTYVGEKTDICAICGWDLHKNIREHGLTAAKDE